MSGVRSLSLLSPGTEQSYGKSIALGKHGEIVVTGHTTLPSHVIVDDVIKLSGDGTFDRTFGDGAGFIQTDAANSLPAPHYSFSESVTVDSRGNIVTAGFAGTWSDFSSSFFAARYRSDGKPDSSFNGGSPKLFGVPAFKTGHAATVMIDGRDRVVVSGVAAKDTTAPNQFAIFRLNDDGTADTSFGDHLGYQLLSEHAESGRSVFAHGGDIVVAGHSDDTSALIMEKRIGYDLPPIMPPDHF